MIRYGDVQRMSAGTGVQHSEFNHSRQEKVHFLQIWVIPDRTGIEPSYEEKHFSVASKRGALRLIASNDGREGSVLVHQDASVYASILDGEDRLEYAFAPGRQGYLLVARGSLTANGIVLAAGDALKLTEEPGLVLQRGQAAEVLLFDLPL